MDHGGYVEGRSDGEESDNVKIKVETDYDIGGGSLSSQPIPVSSWPETFANFMGIYARSLLLHAMALGSYGLEQGNCLYSSYHQNQQEDEATTGLENSNVYLKEPLLNPVQTNLEEFHEKEYWENGASGSIVDSGYENSEGTSFIRASVNGMNVLAGYNQVKPLQNCQMDH